MTAIREAFEAFMVAEGYNAEHWLQRWRIGDAANKERYIKDWVQTAWEAFQAASDLAAKRERDLLDAAKKALLEMCHAIAPRDSFTDAVDVLNAAIRARDGGTS